MKQFKNGIQSSVKSKLSKDFWQNKLSTASLRKILPYCYNSNLQYEKATLVTNVNKKLYEKIKDISGNKNIVIYSIMIAVMQIQMYRYGNRNSIINIPIYRKNKNHVSSNFELPLVNSIQNGMIIKDVIDSCHNDILESYNNQYYSIKEVTNEHIQYNSQPRGQFSLSMSNIHSHYDIRQIIETMENHINIVINKKEDKILINAIYNSNLYSSEIIKIFLENYIKILENALFSIKKSIDEIDILTIQQKNRLLNEFNDTKKKYPRDKSVKELFEKQVEQSQDKIAIVANGKKLSYKELNRKSNQIAHLLIKKGITNDSIVPVICDKSIETIISILGIIKAGGAYLPFDEDYPESRLKFMVKDSNSNTVLGKKELLNNYRLKEMDIEEIDIQGENILKESTKNLEYVPSPNDLLYIIYTSGSTGKPKGVCVEHRNVIRLVKNSNFIEFNENDKLLQTGSIAFDASTFEVWSTLLNGLQLHIGSKDMILNIETLENYLKEKEITICWFTVALFNQLCKENLNMFKPLKYLLTGGDVVSPKYVSRLKKIHKKLKIIDGYGPTENTTFSTTFTISGEWNGNTEIPIGKPIANSTAYILDKNNELLPIGIPGELCLGGDGVARSYLNREDLTKEKFIENPYDEGRKLYKSGDLARWLPDGNIEFLGRVDNQVKIRGFRIELGEIESQLLKHDNVKEAVVIDRKDENNSKYLCGYVIVDGELQSKELKDFLQNKLPVYMVPSHIIQLTKMPITNNGKVDKKNLPKPDVSNITSMDYEAPRNEEEEKIIEIWQETLGIDKVGINDSFFNLGGDSIKAISIISKMHRKLSKHITISLIYKKQTIKKILQTINEEDYVYRRIIPAESKEYYPVSSIQKRMYIVNEKNPNDISYNIPYAVSISHKEEIDVDKIKKSIKGIIDKHETLRTSFHLINGEVKQKIHDKYDFDFNYLKGNYEMSELLNEFIRPFDLSKPSLIRVLVTKNMDDKYCICWDMHHIISDGLSINIFVKELNKLYSNVKLDKFKLQYKDYCVWKDKLYRSGTFKKQEDYWLKKLKGFKYTELRSTNYISNIDNKGRFITKNINATMTKHINDYCKNKRVTKFAFLTTIMNILLSIEISQNDISIGTPISARKYNDMESIIGSLLDVQVIRTVIDENDKFIDTLLKTKETLEEAQDNQDYPYEDLYSKMRNKYNIDQNSLYSIMLNYMNNDMYTHIEKSEIKMTEINFEKLDIKNDITLYYSERQGSIIIKTTYREAKYSNDYIKNLLEKYIKLITNILNNDDIHIGELKSKFKVNPIAIQSLKETLLSEDIIYDSHTLNSSVYEYVTNNSILIPEKTAIEYGDKNTSYYELETKSDEIAHSINIIKNRKDKNHVAIMLEKSDLLVETFIGVMKTGNILIPIDCQYPVGRIRDMMNISQTNWIITVSKWLDKIEKLGNELDETINVILLDKPNNVGKYSSINIHNIEDKGEKLLPSNRKTSENCYIYFTSGSTGKPKGILGRNKSLVHFVQWEIEEFNINNKSRVSLLTTPSFDAILRDIFVPLCSGGTLVIPNDDKLTQNSLSLIRFINDKKITLCHMVPSVFKVMSNTIEDYQIQEDDIFKNLKHILLAGELLRGNDIKKFIEILSTRIQLVNLYGATETTLVKFFYRISEKDINKSIIPVGKPIKNTEVLVLDQVMNKCDIDKQGEIYIRTLFTSSGYYNNKELTEKVFLKNQSSDIKNDIIYKTGDLGRVRCDGNLEVIGRIDNQIKLRGVRIELGEIENKLISFKKIKEAVVVVKEDNSGDKFLCAYISSIMKEKIDSKINISELMEYMAKELPEYMVPSYIIELEKLPLTANGKIDRKNLPELNRDVLAKVEYQAPTNRIEERLVELWQQILGIETIGVNNNFFEIGGHSLKATSLVAKIHKILGVEVPLRQIFALPTIKELAEYIKGKEESLYSSIQQVEERQYYEVSSAQNRIYTHQQLDSNNISYNMLEVLEIEGELNKERLENAFKILIQRHESLRTSFEIIDEKLVQIVNNEVNFKILYVHMGIPNKNITNSAIEKEAKDFATAFDLSKAPLLKVGLIEVSPKKHILLFDTHHIISDGTSLGILIKELTQAYEYINLPKLRIQYKDFAVWQNKMLKSDSIKKQEQYWLDKFIGEIPVLNMPTDYPRPSIQSFEGSSIDFRVDKDLTEKLKTLSIETGSTLYMIMLAILNILLSKYSGQEDIVIGSPTAGRPHTDLDTIIGMFVNTLAMRNYPQGEKTVKDFLTEVKETALEGYENQDYQFEQLVEKLDIKRDMSRNPVFDVMFVMQNMDIKELKLEDLILKPYNYRNSISRFDITIITKEKEDEILLTIQYCSELYKKDTIQRLYNHYVNIAKQIIKGRDKKLKEIELITEEERQQVLIEFNNTQVEYPKEMTLQQLFEEQAKETPNNIALVQNGNSLTYRELNERGNSLAKLLREKEVKSNSIIGLMVDRSFEMIIGILGILKSGAAYMPIDPNYPTDRVHYMLKDSKTDILITKLNLLDNINFTGEIIDLNDKKISKKETKGFNSINSSNSLAYIIYTSGSTGKPKGVMIKHKNIVNTLLWRKKHYQFDHEDSVLQIPSFSFDSSVEDIFTPIISGSKLILLNQEEVHNLIYLKKQIEEENATHFLITPKLYKVFLDEISESLVRLKNITLAGESFTKELVKYHHSKLKDVQIFNEYGPTENSVCTTIYKLNDQKVLIGKPIDNVKCYILNKENHLNPIGVPGELCVSGAGIAMGYLNRKELTEEKFIYNPFNLAEKMYKTGDLAKWLPDGNIEFLGRIDNQVKIRGFRIELGEIESSILKHNKVKEAVIIHREDENNNKYLCGYVIVDGIISSKELKEFLRSELPDYMVPEHIIQLDKIPITNNGKVDKSRLPKPNLDDYMNEYFAPRNELESKLSEIWGDVLSLNNIGIEDNFFQLGGNSLKAIKIVSKVHRKLNCKIQISDIFTKPTVEELAKYIEGIISSNEYIAITSYETIEKAPIKEYYEVSSVQKRMYAVNQVNINSTGYNMPSVYLVKGEFDKNKFELVIKKLISRHEALRTSFCIINGKVYQKIHEKFTFALEYEKNQGKFVDVKDKVDTKKDEFIKPFDLNKAPLIRVKVIELEDLHILMMDMHHIISDGVSVEIIMREIKDLYEDKELDKVKIQYKDFSHWQNQLYENGVIKKQKKFWLEKFKGELPVLNMPRDYTRNSLIDYEGDAISFEIDKEITEKIKLILSTTGTTKFMFFLAVYKILLSKYSGQEDILVVSPVIGRTHASFNDTVGMFVNTLPLRNNCKPNKSFLDFLDEVKLNSLEAFENQDYDFERILENLVPSKTFNKNSLFDVSFSVISKYKQKDIDRKLKLTDFEKNNNISKFELMLAIYDYQDDNKIEGVLGYKTNVYKKDTITKFIQRYKNILQKVVNDHSIHIEDINFLNESEKNEIEHAIDLKESELDEYNDLKFDF